MKMHSDPKFKEPSIDTIHELKLNKKTSCVQEVQGGGQSRSLTVSTEFTNKLDKTILDRRNPPAANGQINEQNLRAVLHDIVTQDQLSPDAPSTPIRSRQRLQKRFNNFLASAL